MSGINRTWRVKRMHVAPIPPDKAKKLAPGEKPPKPAPIPVPDIEPTRIFDNLSVIGDEFVYCFVLETTEGLILIDCLYPYDKYEQMIEDGIRKLDMDPADIKAILLTHGHFDHYGVADRFQKKYGSKVYMAQREYEHYRNLPEDDFSHFPFEVDGFLEDGDDSATPRSTASRPAATRPPSCPTSSPYGTRAGSTCAAPGAAPALPGTGRPRSSICAAPSTSPRSVTSTAVTRKSPTTRSSTPATSA